MNDRRSYDVIVVGAGLVGLATAREFLWRHPSARLAVVEKERAVAQHQSGRNSGVIHSGIYYQPGSLKAQLCVEGSRRLYAYCDERRVPTERCGKIIVATADSEMGRLQDLFRRGTANGVPGLELIPAERIRDLEPHATGVAAIHSPGTGIIDYEALARALTADIEGVGGTLITAAAVQGVRRQGRNIMLETSAGDLTASSLITCGGLHADRLARMTGGPLEPVIVPFRGEYRQLSPERRSLVRALIYPVPDPAFPFLGVHFTRRISGEVWLGPNAVLALAREGYRRLSVRAADLGSWLVWPGFWRMAARYWRTGVHEISRSLNQRAFARELQRYIPTLRAEDIIPAPSGVRAQAVSRSGVLLDDFVVTQDEGILHVRNAPSPAATACLAIASRIVDQFVGAGAIG